MERQMEPCQLIERSIIKKYRKELWTPVALQKNKKQIENRTEK